MNKTLQVLKVNLYNIFGINKFLKKSMIKKTGIILLAIYVTLSVMFSMGFSSYLLADNFSKINMMPLYLSLFISLTSILIFITTMRTSKNNLFDSKDKELLLSLPIKIREILLAKVLDMYIINLLISSLITIPSAIVYCMKVPVSVTFVVLYILSLLIIPIIPTIIGSFFGYLIARFLPKSNKKNLFEIVLSFALFFFIFFVQMNLNKALSTIVDNSNTIDTIMKYLSYPTYLLREALFNGNILYFIYYILINILFVYLFIIIIKKSYLKIVSRTNETTLSKKRVQKKIVSSSITKALLIKEGRKFISSPIYLINSSFGIVLLLFASVASLFYSIDDILKSAMGTVNLSPAFMILLFMLFVIGMTNITAASISIEGPKFWILKSLPVKEKDIIHSKILFSILIVIPASIISILLLTISFKLLIIETFALILFVSVYALVISKFGMIVNLKFPKMDAINDQVVVKQSLSSFISIMGPMSIFIILMSLSQLVESINNIPFITLTLGISLFLFIVNLIFDKVLNKWGIKRIKTIS